MVLGYKTEKLLTEKNINSSTLDKDIDEYDFALMLDQIVQEGKIDEQLIIQNLIKDQF
jgi:hypothetical protein